MNVKKGLVGKPKKKRVPHEETIQKTVVKFLRGLRKVGIKVRFIHPPGELLRTKALRVIYWALGVEAGAPDLLIFLSGGVVVFIELKVKPNKLQPAQEEWKQDLIEMGFEHHVITAIGGGMRGKMQVVHEVAAILNKHGLKV